MTTIEVGGPGGNAQPVVGVADLAELYARYQPMVVAYLRGQGAADPDDLASEAFLDVVRGLERFEGDEDAFRSWLLVIAHRRLVDARRRHGRRPTDVVEPGRLVELGGADRRDVEAEALARLGADRVMDALEQLTAEQRTVVLLHAVGDLSLPEIARIMGKRLGAVKSLHHRGLAAAARALGNPADWQRGEAR